MRLWSIHPKYLDPQGLVALWRERHGAPGLRANYGENYFAAFVIDPDGYQIEAVNNDPA